MKPLVVVGWVAIVAAVLGRAPGAEAKVMLPWDGTCACEWREPGVFWRGKAEFVRCARAATESAVAAGTITARDASRSMRVARRGPCGRRSFARTATCGGPEDRACVRRDDYCAHVGTACEAGRWGFCLNRACSPIGDTGPVCGCDGRTYERYCLAFEANVEVAHFDSCDAGAAP